MGVALVLKDEARLEEALNYFQQEGFPRIEMTTYLACIRINVLEPSAELLVFLGVIEQDPDAIHHLARALSSCEPLQKRTELA